MFGKFAAYMLSVASTSGNMALASIHDLKPEIIISDYKLDDTDGLTLIKQLKIVHSSAQYFILSANERSEILSDDIETDKNMLKDIKTFLTENGRYQISTTTLAGDPVIYETTIDTKTGEIFKRDRIKYKNYTKK